MPLVAVAVSETDGVGRRGLSDCMAMVLRGE